MKPKKLTNMLLIAAIAGAAANGAANAQTFPAKVIHVVLPFGPGGASDVATRITASGLEREFKHPVIVENKPGAGGLLGSVFVAKAPADGYTLLMASTFFPSIPVAMKEPQIDIRKDFAPISEVADWATLLGSSMKAPFSDFRQMVAYAKANPGKLNYGSTGLGDTFLALELIKGQLGLSITNVPYKDGASYSMALMTGEVQLAWVTGARTLQERDKIRPLLVTGAHRLPEFPDAPSCSEMRLECAENTWMGLLAPRGTPVEVIERVHGGIVSAVAQPQTIEALAKNSFNAVASTPDAFNKFIEAGIARWVMVAKQTGLKPQ